MFDVIYNSQDEEYKKPFGAVPVNTTINFKIKVNASCDVKIIIKTQDGFEEYDLEYLEDLETIKEYEKNKDHLEFISFEEIAKEI